LYVAFANVVAKLEGGAWTKPVPAVVNSEPRVTWNPANGVLETVVVVPPPSQLISRRPLGSGPGLFPLFGLPKIPRNVSTAVWIELGFGPAADVTTIVTWSAWALADEKVIRQKREINTKIVLLINLLLSRDG